MRWLVLLLAGIAIGCAPAATAGPRLDYDLEVDNQFHDAVVVYAVRFPTDRGIALGRVGMKSRRTLRLPRTAAEGGAQIRVCVGRQASGRGCVTTLPLHGGYRYEDGGGVAFLVVLSGAPLRAMLNG